MMETNTVNAALFPRKAPDIFPDTIVPSPLLVGLIMGGMIRFEGYHETKVHSLS